MSSPTPQRFDEADVRGDEEMANQSVQNYAHDQPPSNQSWVTKRPTHTYCQPNELRPAIAKSQRPPESLMIDPRFLGPDSRTLTSISPRDDGSTYHMDRLSRFPEPRVPTSVTGVSCSLLANQVKAGRGTRRLPITLLERDWTATLHGIVIEDAYLILIGRGLGLDRTARNIYSTSQWVGSVGNPAAFQYYMIYMMRTIRVRQYEREWR
ncbi:hypothetical protein K474DRAFT_1677674 [Panus rudis PR-1116 ss-1]|nr:hypothetical protein K474DRAFT_1677674 [Panus rudis PR-1116 ss-1]